MVKTNINVLVQSVERSLVLICKYQFSIEQYKFPKKLARIFTLPGLKNHDIVVDPGEGPALIFRPNWDPKSWKIFWGDPAPPLKFWIQHCYTSPGLADTTFFAGCDMHLSFKSPENILLSKNFYMYTKFFYFEQKFDF